MAPRSDLGWRAGLVAEDRKVDEEDEEEEDPDG